MQEEVTFAGLAFVFMSFLLIKTPVLDKLIDVLNSVLGRLRGGPIYTSTVAAGIFGSIAHVGAAVTAAVGTVTVPWMKRTGVRPEIAATVVAGCAGMGVTFPFSATMFILVGGLAAIGAMQPDEIVLPLALAGLWCLGYRIALCFYLVRKYEIQAIDAEHRMPLKTSLRPRLAVAAAVRADRDPAAAHHRTHRHRASATTPASARSSSPPSNSPTAPSSTRCPTPCPT